jgi:putative ABC transport system permease protein
VIKDFNFNSLRQVVTPAGLFLQKDSEAVALRFSASDLPDLIGQIGSYWQSLTPRTPFSYTFMDEEFNRIYENEQRSEKIFFSFSALAILIACMGLLGLSTFAAQQRMKEIAIRKVLGASTNSIFALLSREFIRLVIIAIVVAAPAAWWIMTRWLQNFAYRISMSAWFILVSGSIAILIAVLTICSQVIRASQQNPARSLKAE